MNFQDLKEQLVSILKNIWEKIQESSIYQQLQERYESLNPNAQKAVQAAAAVIGFLILLSTPWGFYSESQTNVEEFNNKRQLIRELLKSTKEASEIPEIPAAMGSSSLFLNKSNQ
jgi:hypothetical protein